MLRLCHIISDNALFQCSAPLTVRGYTDPVSSAAWALRFGDETILSGSTDADASGRFSFSFETPAASRIPYTLTVTNAGESVTVHNILFGELWFAGGQSNMEMPLSQMRTRESFYASLTDRDIRVYQSNPGCIVPGFSESMDFPYEEQEDSAGFWVTPSEKDRIMQVSALALSAVKQLEAELAVPVGFINCNMGATYIENWLPQGALARTKTLCNVLHEQGIWPTPENFNKRGEANFLQPTAMYNLLVKPLEGVRVCGMWWYQGEANVGGSNAKERYREALRELYDLYKSIFAAREDFPFFASLLYSWYYDEKVGMMDCINQAFIEMAKESPADFHVVPNYDLPPVWAVHQDNHPIHPAHKLELGRRFALQTMRAAYGRNGLASAAVLCGFESAGREMLLHFDAQGHKLTSNGPLRCFYIAGADGAYLPAKAVIVSDNTVRVSCEEIETPVRAMYQYMETDIGGNLFCDGIPVAPFCTYPEEPRRMSGLRWLDLSNDSVWVCEVIPDVAGAFQLPLWKPMPGSALNRDTVFTRTGTALRVTGMPPRIGVYVSAYPMLPLNLWDFAELRIDVFDAGCLTPYAELLIKADDKTTVCTKIPGIAVDSGDEDWTTYSFSFDLHEADIRELRLIFDTAKPITGAAFDRVRLIPKK